MEEMLMNLLAGLVAKYPVAMTIFVVIGILRSINKPLFVLLHAYVKSTASETDDLLLKKVEESKIMKAIRFVLDWTASVKLPEKKVVELPLEKK